MPHLHVLASLLALCPQDPVPPAAPAPQEPPRRQRPDWKPSLSLPKDLWVDATQATLGATAEWTNKVELADIDGDGRVDVLFANGGDYDTPAAPLASRVFVNRGKDKPFVEATKRVFGEATFLARVIKVRDVNRDGRADIFVGTTFGTQSRLFVAKDDGSFVDATAERLPKADLSVGDAEFGDADLDGDLDLLLAEWGPGSPMKNEGGRTRLWLNDGTGKFSDATAERMPEVAVRFSWELEWVDVDNDLDLDVLVSSKRSSGSFLFENDGTGRFRDVSAARLPQYTNNYEIELMDLDADGWLDFVTINDGPRFTEHVLRGDGKGGFEDATERWWPAADNPSFDDNMITFLDFDSDGDADFLVGSLDGPDRLLVNDGKGGLAAAAPVFEGDPTRGTLGIALADLDGDHRLDVVHAQGENPRAEAEKVFLGKALAPDTAGPSVGPLCVLAKSPETDGKPAPVAAHFTAGQPLTVAARVHDRKSPLAAHDLRRVVLHVEQGGTKSEVPLEWYGEYLWRATLPAPSKAPLKLRIEATDAAGNTTLGPVTALTAR
ncbi:MAG: VCBS repeat-containing protein [Planctomycetota bacterium]|nr:VCBS repeat-containing protein [Planctomycetota bacterium]